MCVMSNRLDSATLERFRARLEARARDIQTTIERSSDQTTAVKPDSAIGRLTRVDAVQAGYVSDALRREMRAELARIEQALRSIVEGTFGICRLCGDVLSDGRLEAKPDANLCIQCASKRER
jgi:DnaK suppressor protein